MEAKSKRNFKPQREAPEFEQQIVDIARVTRVMAGGKRMRFRAGVLLGDKKGRIGFGLAKGKDVSMAVEKAVKKAEKNMIRINLINGTLPHEVRIKDGAAIVILKPAPEGTGIISGGSVRSVLELAGVQNGVSKILGCNNKVNNVRAAIKALSTLKKARITKVKKQEQEVK
ncbi:MAG: 30S ribosomal protein S5 [bacterium]